MGKFVSSVTGALGLAPKKIKPGMLGQENFDVSKEIAPSQSALNTAFDQSQARTAITNPGQNAVLQQMSLAAQGQGPSLAEIQMRSTQERNLAQQLAATQAGRGGNSALNQRALLGNLSAANRDIGQQAAVARMGERNDFLNQANLANQQVRADVAQKTELDTMNKRGLAQREMANVSARNAAQAQNAANQTQLTGALIGGVGTALGKHREGGKILSPDRVSSFLQAIGQIESNSGKNLNHKPIKHGIHKGHQAIGTYGLMPNTVIDIVDNMGDKTSPELVAVRNMHPKEMKTFLESKPELQQVLARQLAEKVLKNQNGDEGKAAFAWNQGSNLTPDKIEKKNYKSHEYVKRFEDINRPNMEQNKPVPTVTPKNTSPQSANQQNMSDVAIHALLNSGKQIPGNNQQVVQPPLDAPRFVDGGKASNWKLSDYGGHKTTYNSDATVQTDKQKREEMQNPPKYKFAPGDVRTEEQKKKAYSYEHPTHSRPQQAAPSFGPGPHALQDGGAVAGPGTSTSDSIPAMLSDGEFVIRASVVAHPTVEKFLHNLNQGKVSPQDLAKILSKRAKKEA